MPFDPRYEVLPASQQKLWPDLAPVKDLGFTLYGGTAIALRQGHRTSVDFDFFSDLPLDKAALFEAMPFLATEDVEVLQDTENTFVALVRPPAGRPLLGTPAEEFGDGRVKVSFFGTLNIGRVGAPELTSDGTLLVAHPRDLVATKLKALFDRVELKDYADLHELLEKDGQSLRQGLADAAAMWPGFLPDHCLLALGYHDSPELKELGEARSAALCRHIKRAEREIAQDGLGQAPRSNASLGLSPKAMKSELQATMAAVRSAREDREGQ
ncbi:nucleotidyl transferase AbiEii/AbiGii toxin family protein [Burkholderia pseudomallei]|uniref:nucleotidyl transferase AbiEii/AbiGii toxin family protein n=1 Tax=Burkholderia pseudomallei TaxID=28450 RepID=UPI000F083060|nr:nucleotidyl transferase AbiEii/AbiGii toxin family protein [Burkholderia pseudomallei]CAJ3080122.1 Nucleotidyl transferase of uncharacterised function (DUF1814) [Burkholderia pseudomallei]VCK80317.1 Nucleotidyl transferase of uncharacterised function (DUF1814) [Burkholderia pseudomallei]VCK83533.1 Nucleotidyl transferase of uncharacterised function (DUF1814) [Burkholderia pseudomallei]VCK91517.1 Nucleotidyl transferase of uncharacterised function (DUF1814) [Burkholderia pseudomallei]VCK9682